MCYLAGGEEEHVAHDAALRHGLHGPGEGGREGREAAAGLGRGLAGGVEVGAVGGPAADEDLGVGEGGGGGEGEQHGAPRGRVVAGLARDGGVVAHHLVGLPVVEARVPVGEDEELVVGQQVHERVQVVLLRVVRLQAPPYT
jgi:hypothetical protein